jgi:hypothetical protein
MDIDEKYIRKFISGLQKHNPEIYKNTECNIDMLLSLSSVSIIIKLFAALSSLGGITKKEVQPLLTSLIIGFCKKEIQLFSMNSSALLKNSNELRLKPQYERVKQISKCVQSISSRVDIKMTFLSILPDIDSDFPLDEYEEAWEKNKVYIEEVSKVTTIRLSILAPNEFQKIEKNLSSFVDTQRLQKEIEYHATSYGTWLDFAALPDFSKKQILNYTISGIILEKKLPWSILLDIQKKQFPFEQPFYNFARKEKLPIIYCGQTTK